jgi:hypothetical protein
MTDILRSHGKKTNVAYSRHWKRSKIKKASVRTVNLQNLSRTMDFLKLRNWIFIYRTGNVENWWYALAYDQFSRWRQKFVLSTSSHLLPIYQNTLQHIAEKLRYLERKIWIVTIHKRPIHTLLLWIIFCLLRTFLNVLLGQNYKVTNTCGARGGAVVEALHYKPEDRGIDSRRCRCNFSLI